MTISRIEPIAAALPLRQAFTMGGVELAAE
jgi:hypothetical protein